MEEILTKILEGERQIYSLLSQLLKAQKSENLGLQDSKIVYIGGDNCWYFYHDDKQHEIPQKTIVFRLAKLYTIEKTFKGKINHKLRLTCDCGSEQYTIESGTETYFTRSFLMALFTAIRTFNVDKTTVLKLFVSQGDEKVVFPNLHINGEKIKIDNCDLETLSFLQSEEFKRFL